MRVSAGRRRSIAERVIAPSPVKQVKAALAGTKIPVARDGRLRLLFFDHAEPVGERYEVPISVRFDVEMLVTWGRWFFTDVRGQSVEVKGAYHYCIRAFKVALPGELLELLFNGTITPLDVKQRETVVRGLKRYEEVEPWRTEKRDTPLLVSLLNLRDAREKRFSSLERLSRVFTF